MTALPEPEASAPLPPPRSRWLKPLLVVSLALNLAVAGLVVGAVIRGGPLMRADMARDGGPGLGFMFDGLSRADRMALRRALVQGDPDIGNWRQRAAQDFGAVLDALRAEPFDPERLQAVLDTQSGRMKARLEKGRDILIARIAGMTPAERAEFAGRLEERISHLPGGRSRE